MKKPEKTKAPAAKKKSEAKATKKPKEAIAVAMPMQRAHMATMTLDGNHQKKLAGTPIGKKVRLTVEATIHERRESADHDPWSNRTELRIHKVTPTKGR